MSLLTYAVIFGCCMAGNSLANAASTCETVESAPGIFRADPQALLAARASYATGKSDSKIGKAVEKLMADARKALLATPPAVTDREHAGPSSDPHDFLSYSTYYWFDTDTGRYVYRDGHRNPEADNGMDNIRIRHVCSNVSTLALAFYVSGEAQFADKAGAFLYRFFIDPATRMNPNLRYGQVIPGTTNGTLHGIIGVRCIVHLIDAIGMLDGTNSSWNKEDLSGMHDWMCAFHSWLTTSKIGLDAAAAPNNHGSFYDALVTSISLFLGKTDLARKTISQAGPNRIGKQILPDGRQPVELNRTKSLHYCIFNLEALSDLACLGRNVGIDLWNYGAEKNKGRSLLEAGVDFVAPYIYSNVIWPYQQIDPINMNELMVLLLRDASHFPNSLLIKDGFNSISKEDLADTVSERLLFTMPIYVPPNTRYYM